MLKKESNLWCYDVEVYRNFFCVTFYNHITKDKKVFEISSRKNEFSLLKEFVLNTKELWLLGYNNSNYDDLIIAWLIKHADSYTNYNELCYNLWLFSNDIIQKTGIYKLNPYKYHKLFNTINLQQVLYLDRVPYKSLKACAVNLKWPKIQDLPIPFDQEIKEEEIDRILEYNENDVLITNALREYSSEILSLRKELSKNYGLNLMNESNSSICNRILEKEYSVITGLPLEDFKNKRTFRDEVALSECFTLNNFNFCTTTLKDFVREIHKKTIKINKDPNSDEKSREEIGKIKIGKLTHVMGLGGLHSKNSPKIYNSGIVDGKRVFIKTCDVKSYYPARIINNKIYPKHLSQSIVSVIRNITNRRLAAKKDKREAESEGLKIVINSFFGKFLSKFSWLYDPLAAYKVTIPCQIHLLCLIDELEVNGIEVISSNTDGVEALVREDQRFLYDDILYGWQQRTGFELEIGDYKSMIFRDINCYYATTASLDQQERVTIKVKEKGDFETKKPINKSTDFMIIYKALKEYFINNIPVEDTIYESEDILDFCASQKAGGEMKVELHIIDKYGNSSIEPLQKTNRYFVSNTGGYIFKRKKLDQKEDISNQLDIFESENQLLDNYTWIPKEKEQLISMVANEKVIILNNVTNLNPNNYDIKYDFYLNECYKIIDLIENSSKEEKNDEKQQKIEWKEEIL